MFRPSSFRISPLRIIRSRPLRPFASRLLDRRLWQATPHAIGMGAAIGLFFGLLIPVAQILFAVALAVILRGNLLVAATSTLITNPLTFPPIYFFAWKLGGTLRDWLPDGVADEASHLVEDAHLVAEGVASSVGAASGELLLGLVTLACVAAPLGYLLGWGSTLLMQRWRARRAARRAHPEA